MILILHRFNHFKRFYQSFILFNLIIVSSLLTLEHCFSQTEENYLNQDIPKDNLDNYSGAYFYEEVMKLMAEDPPNIDAAAFFTVFNLKH